MVESDLESDGPYYLVVRFPSNALTRTNINPYQGNYHLIHSFVSFMYFKTKFFCARHVGLSSISMWFHSCTCGCSSYQFGLVHYGIRVWILILIIVLPRFQKIEELKLRTCKALRNFCFKRSGVEAAYSFEQYLP